MKDSDLYIEEFTYDENKMIYPSVKEYMKRLNAKLDKNKRE